jgi:hypothetical protein
LKSTGSLNNLSGVAYLRKLAVNRSALIDATLSAHLPVIPALVVPLAKKNYNKYRLMNAIMALGVGLVAGGLWAVSLFHVTLPNALLALLGVLGFLGIVLGGIFSDRAYTHGKKWVDALDPP